VSHFVPFFWVGTLFIIFSRGQILKFIKWRRAAKLVQIEILVNKNEGLVKNINFGQTFKFWSKIKILVKNLNIGQKLKVLVKK